MANGTEQIATPKLAPQQATETAPEPKTKDQRAPSPVAKGIEQANSRKHYQVEYWSNDFRKVETSDGGSVTMILHGNNPDPEKTRPELIGLAQQALYRRTIENGNQTRGRSEAPPHTPEGTKAVRLDKATELKPDNEVDRTLLRGIASRRTGKI